MKAVRLRHPKTMSYMWRETVELKDDSLNHTKATLFYISHMSPNIKMKILISLAWLILKKIIHCISHFSLFIIYYACIFYTV